MKTPDFEKYVRVLKKLDALEYGGRVTKIVGLAIESNGPATKIGDVCRIYFFEGDGYIEAEVVGFKGQRVYC